MSVTPRPIIYLGMDVHKDSITIAVLPAHAKTPTRLERLPNDLAKLRRFLERLARDGDLRTCYEASGAGYVLHRALFSLLHNPCSTTIYTAAFKTATPTATHGYAAS